MKRSTSFILIRVSVVSIVCLSLLTTARLSAQSKAKAENVPEISYDSVPNFFKLPAGLYFGEGIGVATNSRGHVFVYTRSGDTRLFEFDQNGNFVREIGQGPYGFVFAHAIRADAQDNVWCVDEGSNTVIKFNPAGRVVMVLGRRPEAVAELSPMTGSGGYSGPISRTRSIGRPTSPGTRGAIFSSRTDMETRGSLRQVTV